MIHETQIEESLIAKLSDLKYSYRSDIRDRDSLEKNFREKFPIALHIGKHQRLVQERV